MKKLIIAIISLSSIIMFSGCSKKDSSDEFFAWMDAYIATSSQSENIITTTLFFKEKPFKKEDVVNISFLDIEPKDISINSFDIQESGKKIQKYNSYGISLTYMTNNSGTFRTSGIQINLTDKSSSYKIGDWVFDVGSEDSGVINTWSSPAASSNSKEFTYDYTVNVKDAKITEIYFGKDSFVKDAYDLGMNGRIPLKGYYSSPIVYIKTKILTGKGKKELPSYGKGCYCGSLTSSDILKISKERNSSS